MDNNEKQIEKIQKLLALQKDAVKQGSLPEAANAAAKVQALLLKYNLSIEQVEISKKAEIIEKNLMASDVGWSKTKGSSIIDLYNGVGHANFCKVLYGRRHNGDIGIRIIGEPANILCVEFFVIQILETINHLRKQEWSIYTGYLKKNKFFRSFYKGAVDAIVYKLQEERKKAEEAEQTHALVLVKDAKLSTYMEKVKVTKGRSQKTEYNEGYRKGWSKGEGIMLKKGIDG